MLEALLRLRQVACHPGLVDKKRTALGQREAGRAAGAPRGGPAGGPQGAGVLAVHELPRAWSATDSTRPRCRTNTWTAPRRIARQRVARFQTDDDCPLFLLSLKAGGVGLNLTAADYVFILDPWWNPAVEAQAVDRAHRIGQDKRVFVYRLLCRDSVEEKVAALQETKRDLAASIIAADGSVMQKLDRETLEMLLA